MTTTMETTAMLLWCSAVMSAAGGYRTPWVPGYGNDFGRKFNNGPAPQEQMVDYINRLGLQLLDIHNINNDNNIALSPYGAASVLVALAEGLRGDAALEIYHAAHIPHDLTIIRIGLRDIHRHLKTYFIPREGFLAGLTLSHENVTLSSSYEKILRFYGYDVDSFNNAIVPGTSSTTPTSVEPTTPIIVEATEVVVPVATTPAPETPVETIPPQPEATTNAVDREETTPPPEAPKLTDSPVTIPVVEVTSPIPEKPTTIPAIAAAETIAPAVTTEKVATTTVASQTTAAPQPPTTAAPKEEPNAPLTSTETAAEQPAASTEATTVGGATEVVTTEKGEIAGTTEIEATEATENEIPTGTTETEEAKTTGETTQKESGTMPTTATPKPADDSTITSTVMPVKPNETVTTTQAVPNTETTISASPDRLSVKNITQRMVDTFFTKGTVAAAPRSKRTLPSSSEFDFAESSFISYNTKSTGDDGKTTEANAGLKKRSIIDYLIARYYDDYQTPKGSANFTLPHRQRRTFAINGKHREGNINFMTYDTVLPFHYVPHLDSVALSFPLDSSHYYLLLILPIRANGIDDLICEMRRSPDLKYIINNLKYTHVKAVIPSFMLKGYVNLTPTLQKLGILKIFQPRHADFSPMTNDKDIYVTNVEQAITVTIRNYVDLGTLANHGDLHQYGPVEFIADHPFLYFVMDSELHVTLMAGKVINPLNSRIS